MLHLVQRLFRVTYNITVCDVYTHREIENLIGPLQRLGLLAPARQLHDGLTIAKWL